jgi:hypothetical protein
MDQPLRTYVWARTLIASRRHDESGEGVLSSAIAVLIFATLGALMWVAFKAIWGDASNRTSTQITQIGS